MGPKPQEMGDKATTTTGTQNKVLAKAHSDKWDAFDVNKWRAAMFQTRGYFKKLYEETPVFVQDLIADFRKADPSKKDCKVRLIEVGSGTGEFLFSLADDVDTIVGVEFNKKFVDFCNERVQASFQDKDMTFVLGDAQQLVEVLKQSGTAPEPGELVIVACVNNTLGIMSDDMRLNVYTQIIEQMKLDPANSVFVAGYWDGNHFGNSVQHFYGDNPILCGDLKDAVIDWDKNIMTTTSGYTTRWTSPQSAYDTLTGLGMVVERIEARSRGVLVKAHLPKVAWGSGPMTFHSANAEEKVSHDYYDSDDAFKFYTNVWGGDNIHIGCYDECALLGVEDNVEKVRLASARVLELIAAKVDIRPEFKVMDMGSALGGASRFLASTYGCEVVGVDLSVKECEINQKKTIRAGLSHLIDIKCCSFTDTGEPASTFDLIISEDSLLHAGKFRADAIKEAARLLKPGGFMVFTDPMEACDADKSKLQPIYNRIHLSDMGSVTFYKQAATDNGLDFVSFDQMTEHLVTHYSTIQTILRERKETLHKEAGISLDYMTNMDKGLGYWVDGGNAGLLNYGIFVFQKPAVVIEDLVEAATSAADAARQCAEMAEILAKSKTAHQDSP